MGINPLRVRLFALLTSARLPAHQPAFPASNYAGQGGEGIHYPGALPATGGGSSSVPPAASMFDKRPHERGPKNGTPPIFFLHDLGLAGVANG
jgi:hypothetical protein